MGFISPFISSLYDQGILDLCPSISFRNDKFVFFFSNFKKFHFINTQRSGFNTKMTRMVPEMVLFTKKTAKSRHAYVEGGHEVQAYCRDVGNAGTPFL